MTRRGFLLRKSGNLKLWIVPVLSVAVIALAYFFLEPATTGLVILDPENAPQLVEANVTVKTKAGEAIPPDAKVEVLLDSRKASMSLAQFIGKTGQRAEVAEGELAFVGWSGKGFTGDHVYALPLSAFSLDRSVEPGQHIFKIRLLYRNTLLYEEESRIMIGKAS